MKKIVSNVLIVSTQLIIGGLFLFMLFSDNNEDNITESVEKRVAQLLSATPETETIEHDLLLAPVWVRQIIKRNLKTDTDNE